MATALKYFALGKQMECFPLFLKHRILTRNMYLYVSFFPVNCWLTYFLVSLEGAAFLLLEEGEIIKLME